MSSRQPASFIAFRVSKSVVTREVQDQVSLRGFSLPHSSMVRAFWRLNVSSSKKYSLTFGQYSWALAISPATASEERLRQGCPLRGWGRKQNVNWAGQPRVEDSETSGW